MNPGIRQFPGMVGQRNTPLGIFTPGPFFPGFFARVTAEPAGSGSSAAPGSLQAYSWEEVRPIADGNWQTWETARTGGIDTYNAAYEFNDTVAPDNSVVWLWYGGNYVDTAGQQIWDMRFAYEGTTACESYCQPIIVPNEGSGSAEYQTKYLYWDGDARCSYVSDVPCSECFCSCFEGDDGICHTPTSITVEVTASGAPSFFCESPETSSIEIPLVANELTDCLQESPSGDFGIWYPIECEGTPVYYRAYVQCEMPGIGVPVSQNMRVTVEYTLDPLLGPNIELIDALITTGGTAPPWVATGTFDDGLGTVWDVVATVNT